MNRALFILVVRYNLLLALIMDPIIDTIPQLIKDIEQLEDLKTAKENERLALESQNQKLRYRLKFLKEVIVFGIILLSKENETNHKFSGTPLLL